MTVAVSHDDEELPTSIPATIPSRCLLCIANRLSLTSTTRLAVRFFCFFLYKECSHFFVFLSPLLGEESQECVAACSTGTVA